MDTTPTNAPQALSTSGAPNMTQAESGRAIDGLIRNLSSNLGRYRNYAKDAIIAITRHAMAHGDCDKARALVRAVNPKDRSQVINFFAATGPIRVKMGKTAADDAVRFAKPDAKSYLPFDLDKCIAVNWWEFDKPETVKKSKAFDDYFDDILKMVKRPTTDTGKKAYAADELADLTRCALEIEKVLADYKVARAKAYGLGGDGVVALKSVA